MTPLSSRNTRCSTISGFIVSFQSFRFACTSNMIPLTCVQRLLFQRITHCVYHSFYGGITGVNFNFSRISSIVSLVFYPCSGGYFLYRLRLKPIFGPPTGSRSHAARFALLAHQPVYRPFAYSVRLGNSFCIMGGFMSLYQQLHASLCYILSSPTLVIHPPVNL